MIRLAALLAFIVLVLVIALALLADTFDARILSRIWDAFRN